MPDNPYVSAAASAGSAAASLANGLQYAAEQHDRLLQQQRQQDYQAQIEEMNKRAEMLGSGKARIYSPWATSSSGMVMRGVKNPDESGDPKRVIDFPHLGEGQSLYVMTPEEQEQGKLDDGNSWVSEGSLGGALERNLGVKQGTRIPLTHVPALMQALHEAQPAAPADADPWQLDMSNFSDEQGKPAPVMIHKSGKVTKLDMGQLQPALGAASGAAPGAPDGPPAGVTGSPMLDFLTRMQTGGQALSPDKSAVSASDRVRQNGAGAAAPAQPAVRQPGIQFTPRKPADKSYEPRIETSENDNGDKTIAAFDPASGKQLWSQTQKGVGHKRRDPDAQPAEKPPSAAQLRQTEVTKGNDLAKAAAALHKALSEAITPEDRQSAADDYRQARQQAQLKYEASLSALTGRDVGHNAWADQPGQQQQQTKKYTAGQITAWAKANGKDPADAIRRAKAKGLI